MKRIVKCISSIEELDVDLFNRLNIGVEIQDFTEPNLTDAEKEEIISNYKRAFKNLKGVKALHGPFLDLKPASPDLLIREVSYKRYLDSIKIASELNVDYLIFHSQINPHLNEPYIKDLNNQQAKEFWERILAETNFKGTFLIENIFEREPGMLRDYMEAVDFPNIKVNLDIGHAKLGGASLEDWLVTLKDHIAYIHFHSNNGIYDQHQPPTKEEIQELYHQLEKYELEVVLALEYKNNIEEEINRYL